ncbi:MAG TPA: hypothetical protein DEB25_07025 [Desulfobulbaceae bacterium]|nr:hypothetical protein [Desulfobulbaceae bacterium]
MTDANMTDSLSKRYGSQGFTLTEMIMVVALVAIVSAIAIPAWQSMKRNSDLKSAAYEIMAAIQWAKSEAAKRNVCIGINFNSDVCRSAGQGDCYEIFRDDATGGGIACDRQLTASERALPSGQTKILRSGNFGARAWMTTNYGQNAIDITARGLVRAAGLPNGSISLRAVQRSNGNCYNLTISPTAGLRLNPSRWNGASCPVNP